VSSSLPAAGAMVDAVGFNGAANMQSALAGGHLWDRAA
jgi:hypothetical protein